MQKNLLCLFILISCVLRISAQSSTQPVDGFAAEVDGKIITVGDVLDRIRPALVRLAQNERGQPDFLEKQTELFDKGLDQLIEQQLMVSFFDKMEADLPPGALRERKDTILRERFNNSEDELMVVLRKVGKTEADWEEELREQMITQSMIQQFVRAKINVSPREIRELYEERKSELQRDIELKLRSIAFRPAASGQEQERLEKIQEVMQMLAKGTDFSEVAVAFSEGPKAAQGGDEGWVNLSSLPENLQSALQDAEVGTVTPLIETPVQSYIFMIEDRKGGETQSIEEAQAALKREIEMEQYTRIYENWMQGLYSQFQVRKFHPDISAVTGEL